jgi:hypothetical protein
MLSRVEESVRSFVAECFWPAVTEADLAALDERVAAVTAGLTTPTAVRYLGSTLLREDEVVLCQFDGTAATVRAVAERAQIPFERILSVGHSPWPHGRGVSEAGGPT